MTEDFIAGRSTSVAHADEDGHDERHAAEAATPRQTAG
jgi:hypothetical protein